MKTLVPIAGKLTCNVKVRPNHGKVKNLTDVVISFGEWPIAQKVLAGKYTQEQALAEFKRTHDKKSVDGRYVEWEKYDNQGYEDAKLLNLI